MITTDSFAFGVLFVRYRRSSFSAILLLTLLALSADGLQSQLIVQRPIHQQHRPRGPAFDRGRRRLEPLQFASSSKQEEDDELVPEEVESVSRPRSVPDLAAMSYVIVGSTTSIVVSAIFFLVLAWKRDALMVSFFIGSINNGILSKVLKRILNQKRPPELETANMSLKPSDGGMPSSHAMSLGFIGCFTSLTVPWARIPLLLYVPTSLLYRIDAKLHTWQQILVGLLVGASNGALWWHLCHGINPWGINIMSWVSTHLLDLNGILPWPLMAVPAILGLIVVGSFERRISKWLNKNNKDD